MKLKFKSIKEIEARYQSSKEENLEIQKNPYFYGSNLAVDTFSNFKNQIKNPS